jgi:hypothetical protein
LAKKQESAGFNLGQAIALGSGANRRSIFTPSRGMFS